MELSFSRSDAFSTGKRACCLLTDPRVIVAIELFATVYALIVLSVGIKKSNGCISDNEKNETFLKDCNEDELFIGVTDIAEFVKIFGALQVIICSFFLCFEYCAWKGEQLRGKEYTIVYQVTQALDIITDSMVIANIFIGATAIKRQREFALKDHPWSIVSVCINIVSLAFSLGALANAALLKGKELVNGRDSVSLQVFEKHLGDYEEFLNKFKDFIKRHEDEVRVDMIIAGIVRPSLTETFIVESFLDKTKEVARLMFRNGVNGRELYQQKFIEAQNTMMQDLMKNEFPEYVNDATFETRVKGNYSRVPRHLMKELDEIILLYRTRNPVTLFEMSSAAERNIVMRLVCCYL
mmetsp:Transcript_17050/g.20648  ORF Transcript_17050/g.20648 Transcript_17050/m.20648 type:complete len:352 (-) Transcript_17050:83-1138(-)